jgi:hypothetical protein
MVYKPDPEFCLTLLQCGQILQDSAAEMMKYYSLSDPDPYKFDPGGVLAVHMEAGVSSEEKAIQLISLALHRLGTGLKVIAQIQSVNENESIAYTMNSKAQGYVSKVVDGQPRAPLPLAAYSRQGQGLTWWVQEALMPGTIASNEGTQLLHPWFEARCPLQLQALANASRMSHVQGTEPRDC